MSCRKVLAFWIILCSSVTAFAVDISSDAYASALDYLVDLYGIDPNEGLTSLPALNVPVGGRSEAMGTAFSAVSDDASFLEWNPAGSATLTLTELAFFHNNWIADTKIEAAVFATRIEDLGLAVGGKWLYLPFTEYDNYGNRASKGYYAETVAVANASYNFFRGYYFDGISVGGNLKAAYRFVPDFSDDAGSVDQDSGDAQSTFALMADAGALTRFNLFKFYHARERNAAFAVVMRNIGPAPLNEPLPAVIAAGIAYRPIRPVLLSFDYSVPLNLVDLALSERPYWATGLSVTVTDFLSMQAGLLVKGTNPRISIGSRVAFAGVDLNINYTLDLLTQLQPLNRVSLSARFDFGDSGRADRAKRIEELYLSGLVEYANGNQDEALRLWEEALQLDSGFDPAREGRNALLGSKSLVDRMNEIQKLE